MKKVERNLFTFLFHGLLNIFQQIFASFEAATYSYRRIEYRHLRGSENRPLTHSMPIG